MSPYSLEKIFGNFSGTRGIKGTETMKYYWLIADPEASFANWILWRHRDKTGKTLRPRYAKFQCPSCKKLDELAAVKSGIDEDVVIKGRNDITRTFDHFLVVKEKVVRVFEALSVEGIRWQPLPGGKFNLVLPRRLIHVRDEEAVYRTYRPCKRCGRPRDRKGIPVLRQLALPKKPFDAGMLWPEAESHYGRSFRFIISETIFDALHKARVRGLRWCQEIT
jgi:hypothetical protein